MRSLPIAAAAVLLATPAMAHHAMGGAPMETFTQGLLSGAGHPILGFDHLFFILAVGIAAAFTRSAVTAPLGYVAGMLGGCLLIMAGIGLPAVELVIALSLLIVGAMLARGRAIGAGFATTLFAALGLFHGWAFGEMIVGQEGGMGASVTAGYLIGLAAIQWAIAVAAGWLMKRIARSAASIQPRLAGAAIAGVGTFLILESAEGAILAALGI